MGKINIEDGSGDKDFFTMIPNIIKNHSTANDQSLYLQMKGFAGEDGKCFATEKTLMARMGVGKKAFDKSLNYLLEKKWIRFIGITGGKTRPIKTYRIENIWEINSDYYKKISAESNISSEKDKFQKKGDKFQKQHKISSKSTIEEEPCKEELKEDNHKSSNASVADINNLILLFKEVNPNYEELYKNKTERLALQRLVDKFGEEKIGDVIKKLPEIINKRYAPRITTPYQLEKDLGKLIAFVRQEGNTKVKVVKV